MEINKMLTTKMQNFLAWPVDDEESNGSLWEHEEAMEYSRQDFEKYMKTRCFKNFEYCDELIFGTVKLAVVRLDSLLEIGRNEISGMFTKKEFSCLLYCFQNNLKSPRDCYAMASTICDHFGIELDAYEESPLGDFINRLRALTPLQNIALGDALEIAWHSKNHLFEVFEELQIFYKNA